VRGDVLCDELSARAAGAPARAPAGGRMIEVAGLCKRFGTHVVLDGVSLEVGAGEIVALTGPSGCGKTTLLRCVNGLERAAAGTIRVDGDLVPTGGARGATSDRTLLA